MKNRAIVRNRAVQRGSTIISAPALQFQRIVRESRRFAFQGGEHNESAPLESCYRAVCIRDARFPTRFSGRATR